MNAVSTLRPETAREAVARMFAKELRDGYKIAGCHRYNTADGQELFRNVRLKHPDRPKVMRAIHRDGLRYIWGRGERPASGWPLYVPPYPLVETDPAYIVEGEACADALAKLGVSAVTSGGQSSADSADWSTLPGREHVIWPDHDEPGAKYAADVLGHLRAQCCTVRLIAPEIVESLPPKGDVVNWLDAHPDATAADVHALPAVAPPDADAGDTWPEPTPLPNALPPVQAFDAELLPEGLRGRVMDVAERMQCPPDFPAMGVVVALSGLVGARAVIAPKERDDWRVVPNLWGLAIGRPGSKKSPSLSEAIRPLNGLEQVEREAYQQAHTDWEADCKLAELESKDNAKKAAKKVATNRDEARALLADVETPPEPTARRYIVNDSSVEKLADLLTVNQWGVLVYRDELHGLISGMDRAGHEGERGFYLTGYDGNQSYNVDRITRSGGHVPRVCFALLGGMQPGKAQRYVREAVTGGNGDDGLLQRFGLTVWPDVSKDWQQVDRWPDKQAKETARAIFERLNRLETPDDKAQEWRFTPEAQGIYWEWNVPFQRELRGTDLHPAMESHLAKYDKLIPALALLFALVDAPNADRRVGCDELLRALAWGQYLRTHAERLYAAAVIPETAAAETLLGKIRAGKLCDTDGRRLDSFTPRMVAVRHWAGLTTPADVRKAADVLADYDWLRAETSQPGPQGGRPSERYWVHPSLLAGGE